MQCKLKKAALVYAALAFLQVGCNRRAEPARQPLKIEAVKKTSVPGRFRREYDPDTILHVGDEKFSKVRGRPPYYLAIKELNAIYFVTEGKGHQSVCHLFNLGSREDIAIVTDLTELGYEIGNVGGDRSEVIEGARGNILVLARNYGNKKTVYTLDFDQRKVTDIVIHRPGVGTNLHTL